MGCDDYPYKEDSITYCEECPFIDDKYYSNYTMRNFDIECGIIRPNPEELED